MRRTDGRTTSAPAGQARAALLDAVVVCPGCGVLVDGRVRAPVQCMVCGAFVAAGPERLPDARPEVCEGV